MAIRSQILTKIETTTIKTVMLVTTTKIENQITINQGISQTITKIVMAETTKTVVDVRM